MTKDIEKVGGYMKPAQRQQAAEEALARDMGQRTRKKKRSVGSGVKWLAKKKT